MGARHCRHVYCVSCGLLTVDDVCPCIPKSLYWQRREVHERLQLPECPMRGAPPLKKEARNAE